MSLWHMIELCRNRNRQSPLMHGHLGQTLVSDMKFYYRPDVVGSSDSRASRFNCLFCFYGSATKVIRPKRYLSLQKIKMPEFKNTASLNGKCAKIGHTKITQTDAFNYMSYNFCCKRGIRPARTEQFLVMTRYSDCDSWICSSMFVHTHPAVMLEAKKKGGGVANYFCMGSASRGS